MNKTMPKTVVKKHPRKGTRGVKRHSRTIKKKQTTPSRITIPNDHKLYLTHNSEGKHSETTKNPLFNKFHWTTRAHYDLLEQELNSGSFISMYPEFLYSERKDVRDLTIRDLKSFEKAVNKHNSHILSGFKPTDSYMNFSRDELVYGDAMKVLLTPKGRRHWKKTEKHFLNNPIDAHARMESYGMHVTPESNFYESSAGAWMFD